MISSRYNAFELLLMRVGILSPGCRSPPPPRFRRLRRRIRRSAARARRPRRRPARLGGRMFRRKQLAAILILDDRDREGSEPLGLRDDLVLVHPNQRPEHRQRGHRPDRLQVFERLRRDLADHLARSRAPPRTHPSRHRLGDAQHQPAIDRPPAAAAAPPAPPAAESRRTPPDRAACAAGTASAAPRARAPSPARRATGSGSCESARG